MLATSSSSSPLQVCEGCLEGAAPGLLASADVQLKLFAQELQFESLNTQLVLSCVKISRGSSCTPPPVSFP